MKEMMLRVYAFLLLAIFIVLMLIFREQYKMSQQGETIVKILEKGIDIQILE